MKSPCATLGELRDLTAELSDDTPVVVVVRKSHDPDRFYEAVPAEDHLHVDETFSPKIVLTIPEPADLNR